MNTAVVIPTIRTLSFLQEWKSQFKDVSLLIIEDHPRQEIKTPKKIGRTTHHYTWKEIHQDFGKDEWIFSRQNAGIRSYGFWKAYKLGFDSIITIDDDCYPVENFFVQKHIQHLAGKVPNRWVNTFPHPSYIYTRGIPYNVRNQSNIGISHGLWSNKIDLDGQTQLKSGEINIHPYPEMVQIIPRGAYFPLCSMNLAFRKELTPILYFPLMGKDPAGRAWGYDRFDDIWAGLFAKKIMDHLGYGVVSGSPFVEHRKASDPYINAEKEKAGILTNEVIWKQVDNVHLTQQSPVLCYKELAYKIQFPKEQYFRYLKKAMLLWADLFI